MNAINRATDSGPDREEGIRKVLAKRECFIWVVTSSACFSQQHSPRPLPKALSRHPRPDHITSGPKPHVAIRGIPRAATLRTSLDLARPESTSFSSGYTGSPHIHDLPAL